MKKCKLLLISLLSLGIASCGNNTESTQPNSNNNVSSNDASESVQPSLSGEVVDNSSDEVVDSTSEAPVEHIDYGATLHLDMNNPNRVRQEVTVYRYIDGDTTHFNVTDIPGAEDGVLKGRYLAIDTPESTMKVEEWGKSASIYTKTKLSTAKSIIIESDVDYWAVDNNLRHLIWVWYLPQDGDEYRLLNLDIVQDGYSMVKNAASFEYGQVISQAYQQAIREKLGVNGPKGLDPNFYYGAIQEVSLREVRESITGVGSGSQHVPYSTKRAAELVSLQADGTFSENPVYVGGILKSISKVDDEHVNLYYEIKGEDTTFACINALGSVEDPDSLVGKYVITSGYLSSQDGIPGLYVNENDEENGNPVLDTTRVFEKETADTSILKDKKVAVNGIISFISGNTAYLQAYDEDEDAFYGIPVYMGFTTYEPIKLGNELRIVGNIEYYEAGDSFQLSNLTYMKMKPNYIDNMKVLSTDNEIVSTEIDYQMIQDRNDYLVSTLVSANNLTVTKVYTTQKGESAGAMTLTCKDVANNVITVRTGVLYNENKELVTEDFFKDKTIDVTGIFDKYEGEFQIRLLKFTDVQIKN